MTGLEITIAVLLVTNIITLVGCAFFREQEKTSWRWQENAIGKIARYEHRIGFLEGTLKWYAHPANWKGTAGKHSEAYSDKGGRAQRIVTWHRDNPV